MSDENKNVEKFLCSFFDNDKQDDHLVEEPIEMECSRVMCKNCLLRNVKYQSIKCKCGQIHEDIDLDRLIVKEAVKELMQKETKTLYNWLLTNIAKTENEFNDEDDEAIIDRKIEELKNQVRERVQKLKDDLDRIEAQLLEEIDELKKEVERFVSYLLCVNNFILL
jgi:DNA repair exonuclease SbcCD nuclease subunit